ncbi:MAG: DUF1223 domain-containing protein [Pseudomonadota bacterium]
MMKLFSVCAAIWIATLTSVTAGDRAVVVELYTSQGCSSCPPADALLAKIDQRDDVIALALHVDYWDYIGWKDEFADPSNTERQRAYARAANHRSIYTPQMIIQGETHVIGHKPMELADAIQAHREVPQTAEITLTRDGDRVRIRGTAERGFGTRAVVLVAVVQPKATVSIRAGENRGRTLDYHNVVTSLTEVGRWDGTRRFDKTVRVASEGRVAVIVQKQTNGPILTAAQIR